MLVCVGLLLLILSSCTAQVYTYEIDKAEAETDIPYSGKVVDVPFRIVLDNTKTTVTFLYHIFRYRVVADEEQVSYAILPQYRTFCPNGEHDYHDYTDGCFPVIIPMNLDSVKRSVRIDVAISNEAINISYAFPDLQDDESKWGEWSTVYEGVQDALPEAMESLYANVGKWQIQLNADGLVMPIDLEENISSLALKCLLAEDDMPVVLKRLSTDRMAVCRDNQFHGIIPLNNRYIPLLREGDIILTDDGDLQIVAEKQKYNSSGTYIGRITETSIHDFRILKNHIQSSSISGEIKVRGNRNPEPIVPR